MSQRRRTTRITVSQDRGVFMISVAADLAEMHPQTLRMYESKGLITPRRSARGTRLYSQDDVDRLKRIQELTAEFGLNLAGVERVFELEAKLERTAARTKALEQRAGALEAEVARLERLRRELRAEIVPYQAGGTLARREDVSQPKRIPVERPGEAAGPGSPAGDPKDKASQNP
jgi:MerR family transcriptional regulator/heat shock protein HspR